LQVIRIFVFDISSPASGGYTAPMKPRFLALCLNPTIQKTYLFDRLSIGEVNRAALVRTDASGKGVNVARVLKEAGAQAVHLTHAGGASGTWFLSMCEADGIEVRWADSQSPVRICSTVVERNPHRVTELVEESAPVAPGTEDRILALFRDLLGECDFLVVSGTKAAGYGLGVIPEMLRLAAEAGVPSVVDIRGEDLKASLPFHPWVAKPNLQEFLATYPPAPGERSLKAHLLETLKGLKSDFGTDFVITRGGLPVLFLEDGTLVEIEVDKIEPLNPIGSGDAFAAGLALALARGASLREAIGQGIEYGGANALALKPGSMRGGLE
jgi:1-phosphofructokinase/tagatose 6-phosphate kinase